MKAFLHALKWAFFVLLALVVGLLIAARYVEFRKSDDELAALFSEQPVRPTVHRYQMPDPTGIRTIRFIETPADAARPTIIFIHGAPSSLSFFDGFFQDTALLNRAQLVAVDRPGYGYSDFGRVEPSIIRQAELLQPLIDRYRQSPYLVLVGSSYGGSVAARLAMNNPARPDGSGVDHVVFVSSALGPGLERTYPISYWVKKPPLRWLVPPLLQLANDEKLAHRQALEAIRPDWSKITASITMLHGQRDELVYPTNVAFAREQLVNARFAEYILPENRHDIVLNKRDYVTEILLGILERTDAMQPPKTPPDKVVGNTFVLEDVISTVLKI